MDARLLRALPWVVVGWLGAWLVVPRPEPDTGALDALRDSVAIARAQAQADSARLAEVDVTLASVRDTLEDVQESTHLRVTAARQRADAAEGRVRTVLDSMGQSTAALDTLVAAHADALAAKDEEIAARDRERAILYRRVEVSDTLIAGLRVQIARQEAVDAERDHIEARLRADARGAKRRERAAEGVAVVALVVAAVK